MMLKVLGDKLVHHHIGGGGQAFPVPQKYNQASVEFIIWKRSRNMWKDKIYSELLQKLIKE